MQDGAGAHKANNTQLMLREDGCQFIPRLTKKSDALAEKA
jgi:hypothetical protein